MAVSTPVPNFQVGSGAQGGTWTWRDSFLVDSLWWINLSYSQTRGVAKEQLSVGTKLKTISRAWTLAATYAFRGKARILLPMSHLRHISGNL